MNIFVLELRQAGQLFHPGRGGRFADDEAALHPGFDRRLLGALFLKPLVDPGCGGVAQAVVRNIEDGQRWAEKFGMLLGVSPGAAVVYLMAGPATNMGELNAIRANMGGKAAAYYAAALIAVALSAGLVTDYLVFSDYQYLSSNVNGELVVQQCHVRRKHDLFRRIGLLQGRSRRK